KKEKVPINFLWATLCSIIVIMPSEVVSGILLSWYFAVKPFLGNVNSPTSASWGTEIAMVALTVLPEIKILFPVSRAETTIGKNGLLSTLAVKSPAFVGSSISPLEYEIL